ncbi:TFIIIC subunit-domain-containing protein [Aspergillus floccosus]
MHHEPMLAVDPAMLPPSASQHDEDSDYEYEYDPEETETFYLNLDLTSQHGPIRPARRRNDSSATTPRASSAGAPPSEENEPTLTTTTESDHPPAEPLQILGLHTSNPIISYQNQIFSCTWADQIGTELFFTHPESDHPDPERDASAHAVPPTTTVTPPLKRGPDFDLIAANSVKLLGRKANLISSTGAASDPANATTGQLPYPSRAGPPTNQMRFLEQLRLIKQARGETDSVRTVFSTAKRPQNLDERLRGWARADEQLAEIRRLNDAAMQGDSFAMSELEHLYAQFGSQEAESSDPQHR